MVVIATLVAWLAWGCSLRVGPQCPPPPLTLLIYAVCRKYEVHHRTGTHDVHLKSLAVLLKGHHVKVTKGLPLWEPKVKWGN